MIQNIYILAGQPPKMTGNEAQDLVSMIHYLNRLAKGLEYSFEQIDKRLEAVEKNE